MTPSTPCECSIMCQDLGEEGGCRYKQPARETLRRLVDITYQHATEDEQVPATRTADLLIDRAFGVGSIPTSTPAPTDAGALADATQHLQSAYDELCVKFSGVHADDAMDSVLLRMHASLAALRNSAPQETRGDEPAVREACDWPRGDFTFHDEPGEHDPCYVVMPGGAMLPLNHHAGEGVDIARAKFIVASCNASLTGGLPLSPAQIQLIVTEAMLDCWNDICSDTDCHPLDIEHHGGKRLGFHVGHWARQTGAQVAAAIAAPQQSPRLEREGIKVAVRSGFVKFGLVAVRELVDAIADAILALVSPPGPMVPWELDCQRKICAAPVCECPVVTSTSQVSPGFTQCAHCWQPATCKKYGCSHSSNHPREVGK